MRDGMTSGMMMHFNMLRNSCPRNPTYSSASLLDQASSLDSLRPTPRPIPTRTPTNVARVRAFSLREETHIFFFFLLDIVDDKEDDEDGTVILNSDFSPFEFIIINFSLTVTDSTSQAVTRSEICVHLDPARIINKSQVTVVLISLSTCSLSLCC